MKKMKYTSLKTLKEGCTVEALTGKVSDAIYVAKSNTNYKHREAFNTSTVLNAGNNDVSNAYMINVPMVDNTHCKGVTNNYIVDISTEGALKMAESCEDRG